AERERACSDVICVDDDDPADTVRLNRDLDGALRPHVPGHSEQAPGPLGVSGLDYLVLDRPDRNAEIDTGHQRRLDQSQWQVRQRASHCAQSTDEPWIHL